MEQQSLIQTLSELTQALTQAGQSADRPSYSIPPPLTEREVAVHFSDGRSDSVASLLKSRRLGFSLRLLLNSRPQIPIHHREIVAGSSVVVPPVTFEPPERFWNVRDHEEVVFDRIPFIQSYDESSQLYDDLNSFNRGEGEEEEEEETWQEDDYDRNSQDVSFERSQEPPALALAHSPSPAPSPAMAPAMAPAAAPATAPSSETEPESDDQTAPTPTPAPGATVELDVDVEVDGSSQLSPSSASAPGPSSPVSQLVASGRTVHYASSDFSENDEALGDDDYDLDNDSDVEGHALLDVSQAYGTVQIEDVRASYESLIEKRRRELHVIPLPIVTSYHLTGGKEERSHLIASRYQIVDHGADFIDEGAFAQAFRARDTWRNNETICLKIIKKGDGDSGQNFYQGLDEIKILRFLSNQPGFETSNVVKMHDYFMYNEKLYISFECLGRNLYANQELHLERDNINVYKNASDVLSIAQQVLVALQFIHSQHLIHADVKPENILEQLGNNKLVKLIDLGCTCFEYDSVNSYIQSRSYRAPECILDCKDYITTSIDIWSLGAVLVELFTARVLFVNQSVETIIARIVGLCGPIPSWMLRCGRANARVLRTGQICDAADNGCDELLIPHRTTMRHVLGIEGELEPAQEVLVELLEMMLVVDPFERKTAAECLAFLAQAKY